MYSTAKFSLSNWNLPLCSLDFSAPNFNAHIVTSSVVRPQSESTRSVTQMLGMEQDTDELILHLTAVAMSRQYLMKWLWFWYEKNWTFNSLLGYIVVYTENFVSRFLKTRQLQGFRPPPDQALLLDPTGAKSPDSRYRLVLRARHEVCPPPHYLQKIAATGWAYTFEPI